MAMQTFVAMMAAPHAPSPSVTVKYTATQFDTAEDKAKFERQFKRFVLSGFKRFHFHNWFYQRLSNCFGHIAHYDKAGFYEQFFTTPQGKLQFLRMTAEHDCVGDPRFTYSDVEKELQDWVRSSGLVEKYQQF